jgi:hypothetical protein
MMFGTKAASASAVSFLFSSMLTMTWVGASSRIFSRSTDLVPPTFETRLTVSFGWMQKPVRPTSWSASPSSQTSSVIDGTSETIRFRAAGGAVCGEPAQA